MKNSVHDNGGFIGRVADYTAEDYYQTTTGSSLNHRYLKWSITEQKDDTTAVGGTMIQVSELYLKYTGSAVSWGSVTITNPNGDNPANEGPANLIDGNINTKVVDFDIDVNGSSVFIIDAGSGNTLQADSYYYVTGNDAEQRDPISWTIEGSNDGTNYTVLHTVTNATITSSRKTSTQEFSIATITNQNKKNSGVWSMGADYLNADLTPTFGSDLIMHLDAKQGYSGSGTTWSDISGNNYDADLIGTINYTSGSQAKFTWAGGQTASRLHLSTTALSNLTDGYEWTIEFVISINSTASTTYFNSMATSSNNNYYIAQKAGGALFPFSESRLSGSNISLTASETFVFTIVHSGSSQKYYKNGYLSGTWNGANDISQTQGWILNQEQDSVLGGLQSNQATAMSASAILLFDKPLTDVEVLSNYNLHKTEYGLP